MVKVGSDCSGAGAFEYACDRVFGNEYVSEFACDIDKYVKIGFNANHETNAWYDDVYDRPIPTDPLDIYMSSFPCQPFSNAGKRLGKLDKRGILFFQGHEFIQANKPRFFVMENVQGLVTHDSGKTFQEWVNYLGGKSVNGLPTIFPYEDSVPYHLYFKLMNSKHHGVAQNRNRIFIVGIRDDKDNSFTYPKEEYLTKCIKDYLEPYVDLKYILSDKAINGLVNHNEEHKKRGNGFKFEPKNLNDIANCLRAKTPCAVTDNYIKVGYINQDTQASRVFSEEGVAPTLNAGTHGYANGYVKVGTWRTHKDGKGFRPISDNVCPTLPARAREDGSGQAVIKTDYYIRRLTPKEQFRLQDFPDSYVDNCYKLKLSDSQLYKQSGNSITIRPLEKIIQKIKEIIDKNTK